MRRVTGFGIAGRASSQSRASSLVSLGRERSVIAATSTAAGYEPTSGLLVRVGRHGCWP